MPYVIRSMTTTDYRPAMRGVPGQLPQPYHIYLRPADKRTSAWWGGFYEAQKFETFEQAVAERDRLSAELGRHIGQVAPTREAGVPDFWNSRDADHR